LPEVARIARSLFPWHSTLGPGVYISNPRFDTLSDFVYPASFAQQRLWFLDRLNPGDTAYNVPFAIQLDGVLSTAAFVDWLRRG
jgi:hypothetical protein